MASSEDSGSNFRDVIPPGRTQATTQSLKARRRPSYDRGGHTHDTHSGAACPLLGAQETSTAPSCGVASWSQSDA